MGGLLFSKLAGDGLELRPSGLLGSFLGAIIVLLIWERDAATFDAVSERR